MLVNRVEHGRYLNSVALMRVARRVESMPGVEAAALMIGSPSNKALMREAALLGPEGEQSSPNDLVIAIRGEGALSSSAPDVTPGSTSPADPSR